METRKKHSHQSSYFGDQPVRLYADRVPTFTVVPTDAPDSSKIVLNKYGWNSKWSFNGDPGQKSSDQDEESNTRSILRETNDNFNAGSYAWNFSSKPVESRSEHVAINSSNSLARSRQAYHNSHANVTAPPVKENRESNSRLFTKNDHFYTDAEFHKTNSSRRKEVDALSSRFPLNGDLQSKLNSNDERPIFPATSLHVGNSVRGNNDRHMVSERSTKHDRNHQQRYDTDETQPERQTKLGLKVQLHKDHRDGLERVRQLVAKQRMEERDHRGQVIKSYSRPDADHCNDIFHHAAEGQFDDLSAPFSSEKNIVMYKVESDGRAAGRGDLFSDESAKTRSLHRSDDPVQPNKKIRCDPKVVSIPRKVTQAPAPPSYKGFCEVGGGKVINSVHGPLAMDGGKKREFGASASEPHVIQPASVTGEPYRSAQAKNTDASRHKRVHQSNSHAADGVLQLNHPASNKNTSYNMHKKLAKPSKTDINVRSWRAGLRVVEQQLGKMPKMSLSPPEKGNSAEQISVVPNSRSGSIPALSYGAEHGETSSRAASDDTDVFRSLGIVLGDHDSEIGHSWTDATGEKMGCDELLNSETNFHKDLESEKDEDFVETDDSKSDKTDAEHNEIMHPSMHKTAAVPSKAKPVSLQKRKKKILDMTEEKEKEQVMKRDRSYDKEEVKKYIAKQKAERTKKVKEELKEKQRAEENRQRQLEALSRKQKDSAGSRLHNAGKGKPRLGFRDNSTDSDGPRSTEVSSSEERNFGQFTIPIENMNGFKPECSTEARADEIVADFAEAKVANRIAVEPTKTSTADHLGSAVSPFKTGEESFSSNAIRNSHGVQENSGHREINSKVSDVSLPANDPCAVPKSRNHAERLALLEQAARSLTSRLNLQRNTFAGAFNVRDDSSLKSSMVSERNSMVSASNAPLFNGSFASHSLNNGQQFEEEAVNDDSDSTLTEEAVGQPEKVPTSSLHHFAHDGINSNIGLKPTGHKVEIRRKKHDRKKADTEKWVTTRPQRGSSEESTLTGSNISDAESEGRDSVNSASAALPVHLTESGVTADPHSEYVLRLRMLQQSHRANMLSLQAKSRQDFILASRRPLLRNDSTNSDQNETLFQEATSANVSKATPLAKPDAGLINTNLMQDHKLAKLQDLSSFNGTKSILPSGIILAHEAAANDSLESDASSHHENENIFLRNNERKSPSETDLDVSQTESEMERSMRDILPSEKQVKKLRQHGSLAIAGPAVDHSSAKHIFDSESFDSFSLNMVHTYLTQEQSRMHHQHMLLKLREQALAEKTRAHLAWLEQQKLQRKKGSDDSYPVIRQKQKEILEKHKREKASLQALQSLAQQALNIGHGSMSNLESIKYMQHAALKIKQKIDNQNPKVRKWLDANRLTPRILSSDSDVTMSAGSDREQLSEGLKEVGYEYDDVMLPYSELPNEDQQSGENAVTDSSRSHSLQKDEVDGSLHLMEHTDVGHMNSASPAKEKIAQKLKMQMDSRYLTIREKKLRQRRLDAERLLAWKNRLDKEEEEIRRLEMEAAQKIAPKKETSVGTEPELAKLDIHDRGQNLIQYKDCCTSPIQSLSTASLVEDNRHNGQSKQAASPVSLEEPRRISSSASKGPMITGNKKALPMHEFKSKDSVDALPVINISAKRNKLPPKSEEIQANGLSEHINQKQRRESMSETEDSFSALVSETTTDQSELEHQTKALQEELRRKRIKVENLRKLKRKEEMKAKEDCLKKQIELADEEIKKLKHSEVSIPTSLPQKKQFIRDLSFNEASQNISDEDPVLADKRSDYLLKASSGSAKAMENTEEISTVKNTSLLQSNGQVLISRPNSSSLVAVESENSSKMNKIVKVADMPLSSEERKIISEVEDVVSDILKPEGSEESFGEVDADDFFDMKVNTAVPSSSAFTVLSGRDANEMSRHEKQDEFDFEESEKSVSSVASKNSKSELSHSVASSKSNRVLKSEISDELDNKHETASQASEKSIKSVSSKKSENSERLKPIEVEITTTEITTTAGEKLKEEPAVDETVSLENSVHSTASSASKHSPHSHHGILHLDKSSNETIDHQKNSNEDSGSADSVKSSEKYSQFSKVSELSKKSQDGKESARSLSKSYSEDFSSASRKQSKKDSPDLKPMKDDDPSASDSEAEEVKTEDDIRSLLSEDEDTNKSEIGVDKVAESEVTPVKSTAEDVKEFSVDNILKEHLPEIPSEADLNNSADRTLPGDEHSLSGAGDSELERVIGSAAAAVELFDTGSLEIPSSVAKDASFGSHNKGNADLIIDGATRDLVSEAVSEVLAVKSKRELSPEKSSLDQNDSASLSKSPESTKPQQPPSSLPLFDNDWWDGEYLDDDFGWPSSKPPPPYEQKSAEESESSKVHTPVNIPEPVVKISEPTIIVPHTTEEILKLADEVVDIFWHLRRCGESWDDVEPTAEYFGADGSTATPELHSRHMYKQLIFDTVAEFLQEMYRDEDSTESVKFSPLIPPHPLKWAQYYKEKTPPTTLDALRPVVRSYVTCTVGQQIALQKFPRKWLSRRKDDGVDRVLTKELHEEEPEWVSYEEDTVKIKFQLAESIFQILLTDTARTLVGVHERIENNEKSKT